MKIKIQKLQIARRLVQFLALAVILLIPAVARYANYVSARELDKNLEKWGGSSQGWTLSAIDSTIRALREVETERDGRMTRDRKQALSYAQQLRGGPWSVEIGPVSMTDPLAGAECLAASKSIAPVLLISLIIPIVLTVILGRVFCSWICPMNLFLEYSDKLREVLKFLELRPRNLRFSRGIKYALLIAGLAMAAVISAPVLGYIYPPAIIGREAHDLVFGFFDRAEVVKLGLWFGGLTWMSLIVLAIALFEITVSQRWWCRYVCPGGGLYSLLGWARLVRVKRASKKCSECAQCVTVCEMGLIPMQDLITHECDNCGVCISNCADSALGYRTLWRKPEIATPSFDDSQANDGEA